MQTALLEDVSENLEGELFLARSGGDEGLFYGPDDLLGECLKLEVVRGRQGSHGPFWG